MQSLSRKNKGIKYFLCAIDLYSKFMMSIMKKIVDLKYVIELEYLNSKIYLLKDILLIGAKKYLLLIK